MWFLYVPTWAVFWVILSWSPINRNGIMEQSVNHRGSMIDTFSGALNLVQTKINAILEKTKTIECGILSLVFAKAYLKICFCLKLLKETCNFVTRSNPVNGSCTTEASLIKVYLFPWQVNHLHHPPHQKKKLQIAYCQ